MNFILHLSSCCIGQRKKTFPEKKLVFKGRSACFCLDEGKGRIFLTETVFGYERVSGVNCVSCAILWES
jgi:hypothetical protein